MIYSMMIESALRSLLMASIVWAGMSLFRVRHVVAQKVAWTLVLCAACAMALPARLLSFGDMGKARELTLPMYRVLPPIAPLPAVPHPALSGRPQSQTVPSVSRHASLQAKATGGTSPLDSPRIVNAVSAQLSSLPATRSSWRLSQSAWTRIGGAVYLTVCVALLFRLLLGLVLAFRIWHQSVPLAPLTLSSLTRDAAVRISHHVTTPVTIGSSILLPSSYAGWSAPKLRVVVSHERGHVRQGDFYVQLLARFYTAIFWFSPLGWWLQRKLSDLGEAVSDRAALAEAANRPSYAEMLLEFAATPRLPIPRLPIMGVGMVRSSNLHQRIDRLLNETHFRIAFLERRYHAWIAAFLVVVAAAAATARVEVQAAEAPVLDLARFSIPAAWSIPQPLMEAPPTAGTASHDSRGDQARDAYAIVNQESGMTTIHGPLGDDFEKVRRSHSGTYLWFRRDGKSYIIDDPALVEEGQEVVQTSAALAFSQKRIADAVRSLSDQQVNLANLQTKIVIPKIDIPAIQADVDASLKNLNLNGQPFFTEHELSELNTKLAEANKKIAEMQSKLAAQHARLGAQASILGKKQAELAETQAKLAAEQAAKADMASRRMKSLLDRALRDGKAKPAP
jgi:beta-lactamase regulating signal transducer with metallopeptidase domain